MFAVFGKADFDFAASGGEVYGVVQQIVDSLADEQGIALYGVFLTAIQCDLQIFGMERSTAFVGGLGG